MKFIQYFFAVLSLSLWALLPLAARAGASIFVQHSPLAGFPFYHGKALWDEMKPGGLLQLVRERDNPHDANALRVQWNGSRLGYILRCENAAVARQMDRGAPVKARNPWQRILFEVYIDL